MPLLQYYKLALLTVVTVFPASGGSLLLQNYRLAVLLFAVLQTSGAVVTVFTGYWCCCYSITGKRCYCYSITG